MMAHCEECGRPFDTDDGGMVCDDCGTTICPTCEEWDCPCTRARVGVVGPSDGLTSDQLAAVEATVKNLDPIELHVLANGSGAPFREMHARLAATADERGERPLELHVHGSPVELATEAQRLVVAMGAPEEACQRAAEGAWMAWKHVYLVYPDGRVEKKEARGYAK